MNTNIKAEEKKLQKLKGTKFIDEFSKEIYEQTYRYGNETIDETQKRVAKDLARIEKDPEFWENQFQWALEDFKFVPGGRITSNAGTGLKGTSYINCFVSDFEGTHQDSMEGIMAELKRQAMILKSEGGYGFCADVMRPRGGFVDGIGNETPGAVRMLDMWDTQSAVITAGSGQKTKKEKAKIKIRKGAQMVTMSCWHPDIEEFITAKQTPGRLTKFNMSVLITDEFMNAVENHLPWNLVFPDFDSNKEIYNNEWDGFLDTWIEKGHPIKTYKTFDDANELWNLIMQSTYNRNEPGVLFVDVINRLNNLYYTEKIHATNPSLRKGTKILTKNGIFNIEDLEGEEFYVKNLNNEWSYAKCFLSGRNKQLYKITLNNGQVHYATKEHKWPVLMRGGGFAKTTTDNLRKGNLLPQNSYKTKLEINGNNSLSKEEGFMLGWLMGDGWITQKKDSDTNSYGMIFNENEKYIGEIIQKQIQKINKKTINITQKKNESSYYMQIGSLEFDNHIKSFGALSKERLPECIWQSNDEFIKGFIDGIFSSDGYVCNDKNHNGMILLTNKNELIVKELSELLSFYGIKSTYRKTITKNNTFPNKKEYNKEYIRYDLSINTNSAVKFSEIFELTNKNKNKVLKELQKKKYKRISDKNLMRIKSIELTELKEDVWDISVFDETHCFEISHCITGNCGEQLLPKNGVCLLGSLNLTQFINFENRDWDYNKLKKVIPIAVRFMDNVNDITYVPLEGQRESLKNKRRIGLGVMGYGSALMMLKIRYGSKEALELTEKLESFIANEAYQASSNIAVEKGSFPLFDSEKYLKGNFVKNLSKETLNLIKKQGLRNSHLLSIQPTGNSSIFANVVSGGLEPIFLPEYVRTSMMPYPPEGLHIPKNVDWINKQYISDTDWTWIKEGDDNLLKTEFGGYTWKYDRDRGLLRETVVKDYAVRFLEEKGEWDANADWAATTTQLTVDEHVDTMKIFAKYVDSAISKTTNLPHDYPYEDFKDVYLKAYKTGTIKGFTTYRAGTMTEVLGSVEKEKQDSDGKPLKIVKTTAPKRPKTLPCDIYNVTANGEKWIVLIGLLDGDPYEVFAFKPKTEGLHLPVRLKQGYLTKIKKGRYDLQCEGGIIIEDLSQHFETTEQEALTRLISAALRHGSESKFIMEQLNKSEGTIVSFSKAIARTLKKYIPDEANSGEPCPSCGEKSLVYQEGCMVCLNCSSSKC